jgi:hypothetical protein
MDLGSIANSSTGTLANSATPSVSGGIRFATGGTTTITNFTSGVAGQIIIILSAHNITITNGTYIALSGGVNFVMVPGDVLFLKLTGSVWGELCRVHAGVVTFASAIFGLVAVYQPWGLSYPAALTFPGGMFAEESGRVAGSIDFQMALDGTGNSYRAFTKLRKVLSWESLTTAKKNDLETLWDFGGQFTLADAVDLGNMFTGIMLEKPTFKQDYRGLWSGQVEVQQI